jgi:hypothetical protein
MNKDLILQLQDLRLGLELDDSSRLGGVSMNRAAVVETKPIRVSGKSKRDMRIIVLLNKTLTN